jgi:hypothetical protein
MRFPRSWPGPPDPIPVCAPPAGGVDFESSMSMAMSLIQLYLWLFLFLFPLGIYLVRISRASLA